MNLFGGQLSDFFAHRRAQKHARSLAEELCRRLRPNEPILGTALCADEDERYIVRVFCGKRTEEPASTLPPWRECLIVAVTKDNMVAELTKDGGPYQPVIR
ncbi:MAG: hypothetical protein FWC42_08415 [Proteobacteria bacterium]|nr:hypothetical protein [Pseudomonadota bacterium]